MYIYPDPMTGYRQQQLLQCAIVLGRKTRTKLTGGKIYSHFHQGTNPAALPLIPELYETPLVLPFPFRTRIPTYSRPHVQPAQTFSIRIELQSKKSFATRSIFLAIPGSGLKDWLQGLRPSLDGCVSTLFHVCWSEMK